jgi:chromate reductase
MEDRIRILGIAGSLRAQSFNLSLLKTAQNLLPANACMDIFDLADIPIYNQDHEPALPASVERLKAAIQRADAVLFATPEFNYSVSGVLKNAIDWASRPAGANAWAGKPAAVIGASAGMLGTARAQYHLRQILVGLDMPTVNQPEVMVAGARDRFDGNGQLSDTKSKTLLEQLLARLADLARRSR